MTSPGPVVIAGMGPVGATLAPMLARCGVPTVVLEREREVDPVSRAVALDDVALRVLQGGGVLSDPGISLIVNPVLRFTGAAGEPLIDVPTSRSARGQPSVAFFHQPDLDRRLRDELQRMPGAKVLLGDELANLRQRSDGVTLTVRDRATDREYELAASWLVGCDGARSAVRRLAGIRMRGYTSARRCLSSTREVRVSRRQHRLSSYATRTGPRSVRRCPVDVTATSSC